MEQYSQILQLLFKFDFKKFEGKMFFSDKQEILYELYIIRRKTKISISEDTISIVPSKEIKDKFELTIEIKGCLFEFENFSIEDIFKKLDELLSMK